MQHFGNTSCTASTNSSTNEKRSAVGGRVFVQILLVVGACVEVHGQKVLRRHTGAGGVELQLADGNARAVCAEVAQAKNPAAIGDADEPDVFLRPVIQNLFHLAAACDREIHAARWR